MRAWRIMQLAMAGLQRAPLRVLLTTLGVAIASAAMFTMIAFAVGLQRQAEAPFRQLDLFRNIEVKPQTDEDDKPATLLDDKMLARLEKISGVELVYPDIQIKNLKMVHGDKSIKGLAVAVPPEALLLGTSSEILVAGRFFGADRHEALLGRRVVSDLGFRAPQESIGKKVTLEVTGFSRSQGGSFKLENRQFDVVVVGVLDVPALMPRHVQRAVLLPVELMKEIPRLYDESSLSLLKQGRDSAASYQSAMVRVQNPLDLDRVETEIRQLGLRTHTILSRIEDMRMFFVFLKVLLGSVGTVALLVAALGIINTLLMSVLERYQEIGIYKALGASDGDLIVLFLTEAGLIGVLGGIGGLAFGWGASWIIGIGVDIYAQSQHVVGHLTLFAFPWWLLAVTVAFSALVSVVAGVYPALRAARIDPIRVLRPA